MLKRDTIRSTRRSLILGVALWGVLLAAVAAGKAPFGVIEVLFLFAPLVIVPLGLEVSEMVAPVRGRWTLHLARALQPGAAILVIAAFWLPQGPIAGALTLPWVVVCSLVALAGLSSLRRSGWSPGMIAASVSRLDLAVAGAWLLLSRLGIQPMDLREPIILLTAVHFHYTGFATALLAGATVSFAQQRGRGRGALSAVVWLVLLLPFLLAVGFVFSPAIKVVAALLLSAAMLGLGAAQVWAIRGTPRSDARLFLWISSATVVVTMSLAGMFALGEFLGKDWILIPRMAATHGLLNAICFVLPGLVGWLVAWHSEVDQPRRAKATTKFEKAAAVWFPRV